MNPNDYFQAMTFIAPALCSSVCTLFVGLLMRDYRNLRERSMRILVVVTFLILSLLWFSPILSGWRPVSTVRKTALAVAAIVFPSVQLWLTWRLIRRARPDQHHAGAGPDSYTWSEPDANPTDLAYSNGNAADLDDPQPMPRGELTKRKIEEYFTQRRPWLDPEFKLTDLADAMGVNRTEMSAFVNRTFGTGFKRYVNRWRLAEYDRLMALPSGELKNPYRVIKMAGFSDARHYHRVVEQEKAPVPEPEPALDS